MNNRGANVFILGTEYHFLLAMSIIEEHYSSLSYRNQLVFTGRRLSNIDAKKLPENVYVTTLVFQDEQNLKARVRLEIFEKEIANLFVVHSYRALETYILSQASKNTRRHMMQDGSLFYHKIERPIVLNRIRETIEVYIHLWKKSICFTDLILYRRYLQQSGYIQELWMTHPDLYIEPNPTKPIHKINLFPKVNSVSTFNNYFDVGKSGEFRGYNDCLIYLALIIKDEDLMLKEVEEIKKLLEKSNKANILIKLHPGSRQRQFEILQQAFGDVVIKNFVPAEMYIANAKESIVVGSASTALFYNNPECKVYALKHYYQRLGIYANWKNVKLPKHVKIVDFLEELGEKIVEAN